MPSTSRWNLPWPSGTDLLSQGDDAIRALAEALDDVTKLTIGASSARPAQPVPAGRYFLASDTGVLSLSDGANWLQISPSPGTPPIGSMVDYAGNGDPADTRWLVCDGRALSRSAYAALFGVLGTTFGTGDGSTTFNLPDTRGRVTVGAGQGSGLTNRVRGATGGAENHTLTTAQLPSHTHGTGTLATNSSGSHSHGGATGGPSHMLAASHNDSYFANHSQSRYANNFYSAVDGLYGNSTHTHTISSDGAHTHTLSGSTASTGSGSAHPNMQPFLVVGKIIRAL